MCVDNLEPHRQDVNGLEDYRGFLVHIRLPLVRSIHWLERNKINPEMEKAVIYLFLEAAAVTWLTLPHTDTLRCGPQIDALKVRKGCVIYFLSGLLRYQSWSLSCTKQRPCLPFIKAIWTIEFQHMCATSWVSISFTCPSVQPFFCCPGFCRSAILHAFRCKIIQTNRANGIFLFLCRHSNFTFPFLNPFCLCCYLCSITWVFNPEHDWSVEWRKSTRSWNDELPGRQQNVNAGIEKNTVMGW